MKDKNLHDYQMESQLSDELRALANYLDENKGKITDVTVETHNYAGLSRTSGYGTTTYSGILVLESGTENFSFSIDREF